jgi:hypothetical protein
MACLNGHDLTSEDSMLNEIYSNHQQHIQHSAAPGGVLEACIEAIPVCVLLQPKSYTLLGVNAQLLLHMLAQPSQQQRKCNSCVSNGRLQFVGHLAHRASF